jgi:hypothetical protein
MESWTHIAQNSIMPCHHNGKQSILVGGKAALTAIGPTAEAAATAATSISPASGMWYYILYCKQGCFEQAPRQQDEHWSYNYMYSTGCCYVMLCVLLRKISQRILVG